jgi:hypothetical protein
MCCTQGSICFELVKGIPTALAALVIGGVGALIAYRQYRVAHARLKLDLFDKRYAIFQEIWEVCSGVPVSGTADFKKKNGLFTPFNNLRPKVRFLFGPDVERYLDSLVKNWAALAAIEPYDRPKDAEKKAELQDWFYEQASTKVKEVLGPYLNLEEWK